MSHIEVIKKYFAALKDKNANDLIACYDPKVVYSDPLYGWLEGTHVFDKWKLFMSQANDFNLTHGAINVIDDEYFSSEWLYSYTLSTSGKKVKLKGKAFFRLKDHLIIEQSDAYRFSTLIAQTHGWKGYWLGWTGYMKRKVKMEALAELSSVR